VTLHETIPSALAGERVDRAIALLTGWSRAEVAALVDSGAVRIGGRMVRARSRRVAGGEVLDVEAAPPPVTTAITVEAADAAVPVPVVYADADVIVVDKPAGVVVHPGAGQPRGTMVHGLVARFPDLAALGGDRPGIVHRLDKGTSGLLVVARTEAAREDLVAQLASRQVERRYAALVWGIVEAETGLIDAPLERAQRDPTRMAIRAGGRDARTRYAVERRLHEPVEATLLECRLETGRTHQIRAHLAAIGHPVVGDARYGRGQPGAAPTRAARAGLPGLSEGRQFLHARRLAFDHPASRERMSFDSPLPGDLVAVLEALS
jgi:23S rRNA pseudouridine1911/1915/1917 synthase